MNFKPPEMPDYSKFLVATEALKNIKHPVDRVAESSYASVFQEIIIGMIAEFEENLDTEQEVGAKLVNFGREITIYVIDIGFYDPSLIVFYGSIQGSSTSVELIQNVSQINFLLVALPKQIEGEEPRRIGFKTDDEPS